MAADSFLEEDFRVLTPEAFDFVLNNELKRAVRSQNFLTLLLVEPSIPDAPAAAAAPGMPSGGNGERERLVRQVAGLVSREVRETDLLSQTGTSRLSVVLLDADLQNSMRVVERLMARLEHYEFPRPIEFEVGAACCPTHGADAESLLHAAEARPVRTRRTTRGSASNAQ
jgi:PleD family two-component response regulator